MNDGASPDQPAFSGETNSPVAEPPTQPPTPPRPFSTGTQAYGANAAGQQGNGGWSEQAADLVVETVDKVRIATTDRIIRAAKAVVYGLTIGLLALMVVPITLILVFRIVDVYLPGNVWSTYLLFGIVFLVAGSVFWSKRRAEPDLVT